MLCRGITCAMCYVNHVRKCYALKMQIGGTYIYAKMRSAMCYLQKIRCYMICKITISCYVLYKIKWPLLCAMCWKMASAMCYVKPLERPTIGGPLSRLLVPVRMVGLPHQPRKQTAMETQFSGDPEWNNPYISSSITNSSSSNVP